MMKLLIILMFIFLTTFNVNADTYDDSFCPQGPFPVSTKFIQSADKITGMNFLTTKILETSVKNQLKKDFGGAYKVDVQSFSTTNLAGGKFKNLTVEGEGLNANGVKISNFYAKSLCEYAHLNIEKEKITFVENMLIDFNLIMNESDLKESVMSKIPQGLSYPGVGVPIFKLDMSDVLIRENDICFVLSYLNFFTNKKSDFKFKTSLDIQNGKIVFTNIEVLNSGLNLTPIMPLLNLFNPFVMKIDILDNKNSVLRINNVKIKDKQIMIDGKVYMPKNIQG